jgi:two-component system chemotaxis response regulator CheB
MPPVFTELMARRLDAKAKLAVHEGRAGEAVTPGTVWIAPGDWHLVCQRRDGAVRLAVNQDPPENSCRPSGDVLLRSVAATFGGRCLAVMLTGMGHDGLRGCEQVRAAGGQVVAQDEATSVVWGIPGAVVRAGLAERVLPLGELAAEIVQRAGARRGSFPRLSIPTSTSR